ncbi:MAG: hypothetical protein ACT4P6_02775 [Gemmatimonadaceae bacterium]
MTFPKLSTVAACASRLALLVLVLCVGSCADSTSPDDDLPPIPAGLTVLRIREGAPSLQTTSVSFWAKRGEERAGYLYFTDGRGGRGSEYLRVEVKANSLVNRPNGSPIAVGDSILITIRVTDQRRIRFKLEPDGLLFDAAAPARLITHYVEADHDFNADGRIDAQDLVIEMQLANFRQARLGDPFLRLTSIINLQLDGIASDLPGFSHLLVAY